jgi:type I restriction enzyme R subunit
MRNVITENEIEEIGLEYLAQLGYGLVSGPDISPDGERPERQYNEVILPERLRNAIDGLNPNVPTEGREEAIRKVLRADSPNLLINNETFHKYLTEGVDIEIRREDGIRGEKIYLVDFENPENNEFLAVNQFTVIENNVNRRPDIILFVNGLPLVLIELKNAPDENATIRTAFNQLQTYKAQIPSLFVYNALLIVSDGWDSRCGTLTSPYSRFMAWKKEENKQSVALESALELETMMKEMLRKDVLLDLIRHFIVFEKREEKVAKKVAAYHQYYAVNKALARTIKASSPEGDKRAGVVWHTQGSGKSLSMVFYAGKVVLALDNPTIVVLTDRNDLDDQLFETFDACSQILRQRPRQAEDRRDLRKLLSVASGGIVFSTIQKFMPFEVGGLAFADAQEALSERRNIIVVADEAHRSQYDFIDGYAKHLRDSLPNASFIGFTGTPIESSDRNTPSRLWNVC